MLIRNVLPVCLFLIAGFVCSNAQKRADKEKDTKKEAEFIYLFDEANKNRLLENYDLAEEQYLNALEIKPTSAGSSYYLASIYITKKEFESAFKYARKAVELQPGNFWYKVELADIYYLTGNIKESIKLFQEYYTKHPENDFVFNRLTKQLNEIKDYSNLIKVFEAKDSKSGLNEQEYNDLYQLYKAVNATDKAELLLNRIVKDYPNQSRFGILLAEHYIFLGNKEKAKAQFQILVEQFPEDTNVILSYAWFTRSIGEKEDYYKNVKKLLESDLDINTQVNLLISGQYPNFQGSRYYELLEIFYSKHPDELIANTLFAEYYIENEQKDTAVSYIKKALNIDQNNFNLVLVLFELLYDTKNFNDLKTQSEQYRVLYPNHSKVYLYQGLALYETGEYESAVKILETGIELVYDDRALLNQFYYYLAECFHELGNDEKSDSFFEKLLSTSDNFYIAYNKYAFYLTVRGLNIKKATELSKKCVLYDGDNPVFAYTYAFCLYKSKDYSTALVYSEKAIQKLTKNDELLDLHGNILFLLDRRHEALNYWNQSKQAGNNSEILNRKIKNFEQLKKEDIQ